MNIRDRIYNTRGAEFFRNITETRAGLIILSLGSAACVTGSVLMYEAGEKTSGYELSIGAVLLATAAVAGKVNRES